MAVQRNIVKYLFFLLLFFSVLNLETSSSAYLISKNKLDEILNSNCFLFDIHSELKIKCYFDLICSAEKPIKGFENYFLKDEKIFELLRLNGLRIIDAYNAWNSGLDFYLFGDSSRVGIIDSGIDTTHKDFDLSKYKCFYSINGEVKENDWSYCNDSDGHGTHVAGIVAGKYDKNISKCLNNYPCGVAPNATLFIARVFSGPTANLLDILNALDWIVENNVNIISMSFGADLSMLRLNSCYPLGNSSEEVTILLFSTLMDFLAIENNLILIAAAGNNPNSISTPACAKSVIAVGAIDKNRNLAFFSSRGPIDNRTKPDIVAPGVSINSTYPQNTYSIASGTSMATPFVSGAIALLLDMLNKENTTVTSQEVKAILLTSANELTRNNTFGSGILNVSEMIRIRNNFLTIDVEDGEVLRFKVNKTDSYPFKFTIYRHETVLDFTKYNVKIIKDGAIIFEGESIFDNVFQYKNDTLNGDFEIEVKINHNSTMVDNKFTFVFSHRILNLSKFLEENLNNSIQPMLNVTIDPSIEFGLNPINRRIGIFVSDFAGMPIRADIINVSIVNSSGNIIHSSLHFNTDSIYLEIPSDLTEFNYTLYVVAEKGKRFGVVSKNFTYTPFYLISPNKVLKVMNGDLLNITINFDNNINNIAILEAFLYLEGNKDEKLNISFSFNDNIAYNITNINLNQKGKYFLFLNVSLGENNVEFEIPILEFSSIFDYTISYPRYMFADKEYTINIDIFHINGSRVNIEKTICIENDTNKIFCNSSLSNNIKIFTNISVSGDYNLNISAIDNNGNFLNEKIPITINFIPDRIIINKQKEKFTILEPLDVSAEIINSTKNSQCSFCTVFVNMTKDGKIIFSRKSFEDFKNFVIPKDFESGKYKLTFFSQTNSTILNETEIEIETLEILTNVSEKVFPNYYDVYINISVNATSNVSISISRINISEESIQLNPSIDIETISGCENKSIDETNKILWCNSTSDIILKINSSETSTFFIEIIAYGDNINGYLLDKFYSGFLIRPHINSKKKSCDEISLEDTLINPYIKNNCFVDSRNQRDMSINRNERVLFSAIAYAGATLDKIISTNVTINVTYNGITKYLNSSSFENLIFFNISNFTDLGKYAINLTYVFKDNEIEISKQELYEINVYDINYSITIPKNYTKIFGILSFISQINRTNGISEEKIRNITRISSETPSVKIASYNLNTTSSKLIFNVTFEKSFNGDVKIKIEDELGIEKDIIIKNITAYDLYLSVSYLDTIFKGSSFQVSASSKLLPFEIPIAANYSIQYSGGCELLTSKILLNREKAQFLFNATEIGSCEISIYANATYLDLFFEKSISLSSITILPSQKTGGDSIPPTQKASLIVRKSSDSIIIGEKGWNTTIVFVKSIGRDQTVWAEVLNYPKNLVKIFPESKLIKDGDEEPFIFNISISPNENRSEFEIELQFNSVYAKNQTKIKVIVLKKAKEENKTLEKEISDLESEVAKLESEASKLNREDLLEKLLNARRLISDAREELNKGNIDSALSKLGEVRNIINSVKDELAAKEAEKKTGGWNFIIVLLIIGILVVVGAVSIIFIYPKIKLGQISKPYYDAKRKKFVWTSEDETVWERLKEKWRKRQ